MIRLTFLAIAVFICTTIYAQSSAVPGNHLQRPKLVVGIVVDQMRWDFLYRFYDRYAAEGGFKRMLNQGFSCENTLIPYSPTVTAPGHATIYTGTVPAIHGIAGNLWWDNTEQREIYCTEDKTVQSVGSTTAAGLQSPRNMKTNTVCDELRLATNFKSKVIGIAIKDRGGILPAGHSANAAYWYESGTGNWISSTYYMNEFPKWVTDFNNKKLVDKYYAKGWNTLYPIATYTQSTEDIKPYEHKGIGTNFPYDLSRFIGKNYSVIGSTPHGNTFTLDMSKAALEGEGLGTDAVTDFLAISLSSPDYIGHGFGPNSIEQEDDFLRLDLELGEFFTYLDTRVGAGQYTVFLSADHGVAHIPEFLKENKLPAGSFNEGAVLEKLNQQLKDKFGKSDLALLISNAQLSLNNKVLSDSKIKREEVIRWCIDFLSAQEGVARVFEISKIMETSMPSKLKEMLVNGYYPQRGGDIQLILHPGWIEGFPTTGTTHGLWSPYDTHIPLLWYGWGINKGKTNRETYMTDIAPTLAALLKIQMPNGSIGKVISEVIK